MLENLIKAENRPKRDKNSPKKVKSKAFGNRRKSQNATGGQSLASTLKNAKDELKDREDQLKLLNDMFRSSNHQNSMKDQELERLKKKVRIVTKGSSGMFKVSNAGNSREKNRTGNTFLPGGLRGSMRPEAGFPMSNKSGRGSMHQKQGLPSIRGAKATTSIHSNEYDYDSQRSQSQISLAISQKRGEKIVKESRRKAEALKETPRMYNESRVTGVDTGPGGEDMINLQIQEEDAALEEGTMRFVQETEQPVLQDQPEYEDDRRLEEY